jgi:hypothetical protein
VRHETATKWSSICKRISTLTLQTSRTPSFTHPTNRPQGGISSLDYASTATYIIFLLLAKLCCKVSGVAIKSVQNYGKEKWEGNVHKTKASDCSLCTKVRRKTTQHWSHKSKSVTVVIPVAATSTQELTVQADEESAFQATQVSLII